MARIANTPREIARNALAHVENCIHQVNDHLREADEGIQRLTDEPTTSFVQGNIDAYKTQLEALAATKNTDAVATYRWIMDEFSLTVPAAYTDAEIDAIDPDIRTHDDGLP